MLVKFEKGDHSKLDNKDLPVLSKSQSEVSIASLARVESWRIFTFAYEDNKTPAFYDLEEALDKWRSMGKVSIRAGPNKLSVVSAQGHLHCNYGGICDMNRCACKKAGVLCNSRCHPKDSNCVNKKE